MIRNTLIITVILLTGYNFMLSRFMPTTVIARHQLQGNNIRAEQYVFSDSVYQRVIVGSSLANRIPAENHGFYNLAFAGQSLYDGLNLILQKKQLPKQVLIETNILLRQPDESFTSSFENPVLTYARKSFGVLRDGKRPMDITAFIVEQVMTKLKLRAGAVPPVPGQNPFFEKFLQQHVDKNSVAPAQKEIDRSLALLKNYVDRLEGSGVEVIFFEMPVHQRVCDLVLPTTIQNEVKDAFPPSKYRYIPRPACSEYTTTDGLHLDDPSSIKFAEYLKQASAD